MVRRRAWTRAALVLAQRRVILFFGRYAGLVGEPDLYGGRLDALLRARSRPGARESAPRFSIAPSALLVADDGDEPRAYDIPWRAIPELNVCLATTTRNSSKIHWQRSTIRQRTTPCTAGIGPLSSIAASAARCAPFRPHDGCPGRLAINQPFRPMGVELHHPIANDLERHPADLRRLESGSRLRKSPPAPEAATGLRPILPTASRRP